MNPKPFDEYKDSGVDWIGSVPAHWPLSPLRSVVEERRIKNPDGNEAFYLSLVSGRGVIPYSQKGDIGNKMPEDLSRCKVVEEGDLVINSMNYGIGSYGVSSYQGICSPVYIVLRPKPSVDVSFIKRIFEVRGFQKLAQSFGSGILEHRSAISWQTLKTLRVPVPTLTEQRVIAEFLDRETAEIDAFIADQERLIELLEERRAAMITHAVTKGLDPNAPMKDSGFEEMGPVPLHWNVSRLKWGITKIESGTSVNAQDVPVSGSHEVGVLKTSCVYTGEFDPTENKTVNAEDLHRVSCLVRADTLIVSRMNTPQLIGAAGYTSREEPNIYLPDRLWQVYFHESWETQFIHFWSQTPLYRMQIETVSMGTSSSMKNIGQDDFRNLVLYLPPHHEQKTIVSHLTQEISELDAAVADAREAIALSRERRAALISAAVTGQLDVSQAQTWGSTSEVLEDEVRV